jgi:formate hydrogenlyase subunit 4
MYGGAMKLFIFGSLLVGALAPLPSQPLVATVPLFAAFLILLAMLVGVVESLMARLRLVHVPTLLIAAVLLAAFALLLSLRGDA